MQADVRKDLVGARYALTSDGWSKKAAAHGIPLINFMILPDNGAATFHRIHNAEGEVNDADWIAELHNSVIGEVEDCVKEGHLSGVIMDNTSANRAAMALLELKHPTFVFLGCCSHGLSLVIKHLYKRFAWLQRVYDMCNTVTTSLSSSSILRAEFQRLQLMLYQKKQAMCTAVDTRFGSKHFVMRDVVRSKEALMQLSLTPAWGAAANDKPALKTVHVALTDTDEMQNLWWLCTQAETLVKPVMDAIHLLEADQSLLCHMHRVLSDIEHHFAQFALQHPTLAAGAIPNKNGGDTTLYSTITERCNFIRRPAMLAAHLVDPLNWKRNADKSYVPKHDELNEAQFEELEGFVDKYGVVGEGASELAMFRVMGVEARYEKTVAGLTKLNDEGRVPSSTVRIRIWQNMLANEYPVLAKVAACVMSMPVTACASERNWTQWGHVYVEARSKLGLRRASDLIYIKQNDKIARGKPADMSDLAVLLDTMDEL